MKNKVLSVLAILINSCLALAQAEPITVDSKSPTPEPTKFSVQAYYNLADSISSDEFAFQSGALKANGSSKAEIDKGFGIGFSYYFSTSNPMLKIETGLIYEMPKSIKTMSYNLNGTTITGSLKTAKISYLGLIANLNYSLDPNNYLFAGANATKPDVSGITGESVSTTMYYGAQLGYGYNVNEKIALEALYKRVSFNLYQTADNKSYYADHIKVYSDGLQIQAKFKF